MSQGVHRNFTLLTNRPERVTPGMPGPDLSGANDIRCVPSVNPVLILDAIDQGHGMDRDPLARADPPEPLIRLGLHRHSPRRDPDRIRKAHAHRLGMRSYAWPLGDHRHIDIDDLVILGCEQRDSANEKADRIRVAVYIFGRGEMRADVAEGSGAEEGVSDGVGHRIGVGVPEKPKLAGNYHAAQDEPASRGETMRVVPVSDAHDRDLTRGVARCRRWAVPPWPPREKGGGWKPAALSPGCRVGHQETIIRSSAEWPG